MMVETLFEGGRELACASDLHEHYARLLVAMSKEPWREPDFGLEALASTVGLREQRLREVLRRMVRQDCDVFIDRYRAIAATRLLSARPRPALRQAARLAGFPSLARFHDAMVEFTQMTPLRYVAVLEQQGASSSS